MHQHRSGLITFVLLLIVGAHTLGPAVMLIVGSFSEGLGAFGTFTWEKYTRVYTDARLYSVLWDTLLFTLPSAVRATSRSGCSSARGAIPSDL